MGRSFSRVRPGQTLGDVTSANRLHHKASDRYYTMVERGGAFYQRRHQVGFESQETNVVEVQADYVIGSGNHARTFVHRSPDGRLLQLPVSWYTERGGYWAMSPGYDRPAHLDFRRVIDTGCMSCHNGYPRTPVDDDGGRSHIRARRCPRASIASGVTGPARRTWTRARPTRSTRPGARS
jgi:hypothetical protein